MKKKLYLRIRVLVLVLLLILSSLIIAPEQVLADTEVVAGEETPEVTSGEEAIPTANDTENQNDSGQPGNETETETETTTDTETDEPQEKISESAIGTDPDSTEAPSEPELDPVEETEASATVEATNETDDVTSEATTLPTTESTSANDSQSTEHNAEGTDDTDTDTLPTVESPEAEQTLEEAISGKQDKEDADTSVSDPAERNIGTRAAYSPEEDFVFDPGTGTIVSYKGTSKDVNIPPAINGNAVITIGNNAFCNEALTSVTIPDCVMYIRAEAFANNKLTSITIPGGAIEIGFRAFSNNELTNVTIPNYVWSIGEEAFCNNQIIWASIPENIIYIEDNIGNQLILPTIEQIGAYCFDNGVLLIAKRYIKANYNIRETPNGKVITKLWRPLYVTGTSTSTGAWLKFTYNGNPAYVIMEATTNTPPEIAGFATGILNLRDEPGGSIIGTIPIGHKVQGKLVGNTVKTTYNGKTGYVYASLLQKDPVQVTRYIKAGSNIRKTPGGTIIETLKMPVYVSGTIQGNYLRFTYKGQTAYVPMSLTTTQNPPITGYAKQKTNVRSSPNGSVIGSLTIGSKVSGTLLGNWVRFTYAGKTGYVYSSLLQADPVNLTCYVKAGSNIRSSPGGTIIATLKMPIFVTGTISGNTLRFTYKGKAAYVGISLITTNPPPITGYTKSTVNVRSSPGGSVIGSLPANRKVSGTLVGNWVKFNYSGKTGYIYASLLK